MPHYRSARIDCLGIGWVVHVITGNVSVDQQSSIMLQKASVELAEGSTMTVEGALSSNGGQIILNDAAADTVSILKVVQSGHDTQVKMTF